MPAMPPVAAVGAARQRGWRGSAMSRSRLKALMACVQGRRIVLYACLADGHACSGRDVKLRRAKQWHVRHIPGRDKQLYLSAPQDDALRPLGEHRAAEPDEEGARLILQLVETELLADDVVTAARLALAGRNHDADAVGFQARLQPRAVAHGGLGAQQADAREAEGADGHRGGVRYVEHREARQRLADTPVADMRGV
eukprot:CAMPEP_0204586484 /NCGR_PEP_ID=MMETSP0661-20131031/47522_1 /ASSEMBLY_ACC=CAM_ASM_000606 /TAXON_ID=109239 /ORGANISM="Alexandrium margalefi, Strain AMGDE01CS-322" /LENGTH=196 /DNA_ID=CAMNT_0051596129 /DNA_START=98 /DNA_END=688 /DNA_ORIENTATION=-